MKSLSRNTLAIAVLLTWGVISLAAEKVSVPGSDTQYDTRIKATINDKPVSLVLTGAGLHKHLIVVVNVSVYTIASYVEEGAGLHSAAELAAADRPKRLVLVMERDVDGPQMAEAIVSSLRENHPAPDFADEVAMLDKMLRLPIPQKRRSGLADEHPEGRPAGRHGRQEEIHD